MPRFLRRRIRRFLYWTGIRKRPKINVRLSVDTSKFERGLRDAQEALDAFAANVEASRYPMTDFRATGVYRYSPVCGAASRVPTLDDHGPQG